MKKHLPVQNIYLIFALSNIFNGVNHRIYFNEINALGVNYLNSCNSVISVFGDYERFTSFLFIKTKIFTNAKHGKNFGATEAQYFAPYAPPGDTGPRPYFRGFYATLRAAVRQICACSHTQRRYQHHSGHYQEKSLLRAGKDFCRSLRPNLTAYAQRPNRIVFHFLY